MIIYEFLNLKIIQMPVINFVQYPVVSYIFSWTLHFHCISIYFLCVINDCTIKKKQHSFTHQELEADQYLNILPDRNLWSGSTKERDRPEAAPEGAGEHVQCPRGETRQTDLVICFLLGDFICRSRVLCDKFSLSYNK